MVNTLFTRRFAPRSPLLPVTRPQPRSNTLSTVEILFVVRYPPKRLMRLRNKDVSVRPVGRAVPFAPPHIVLPPQQTILVPPRPQLSTRTTVKRPHTLVVLLHTTLRKKIITIRPPKPNSGHRNYLVNRCYYPSDFCQIG